MKFVNLTRSLLAATVAWLTPVLAMAAPLAERVPAQTNLYIGWSGNDALAEKVAGTRAGNLLDASNLPQVLDVLVPRIAERIRREDEEAGRILGHVGELVQALTDKPGALFFGGIGENAFEPGEQAPRIGLIIDAGEDVLEVRGRFEALFNDFDQDELRALVKNDDRYVMMYFGYADLEMAEAAAGGEGVLAGNDQFAKATADMDDSDLLVYVSVQAMLQLIDDAVAEGNDQQAQQNWPVLRDTLGLSGVDFAVFGGAFDADRDGLWVTRGLIAADAPRTGLLAFNEGPMDTDLLLAVPQDATFLNANKFNLQAFIDTLKATATAIDPEADTNIRQGIGFANLFVGRNIERDIFQQFGHEWAVYRSDSVATGLGGWIVVNKVQDEKKLRTSLVMLGTALVNGARSQIDREDPIDFDARKSTIDGVDVYYLGTPLISPAFAIEDGYFFAALQPQSVAAAANAVALDGSILDNEKFHQYAMVMQADGAELRGVQFYDVPETAPRAYATFIALTRGINGGADLFKVEPIDPILPTLPTLLKNLTPGGGVVYATDEGLRFESVGTFPGANSLLADPAVDEIAGMYSSGGGPLMVSILLPSLNRARETANRVKSASNLRQIGLGAILYANEQRNGAYPQTIGEILETQDITAEVFINPRTNNSLPPGIMNWDRADQGEWATEQGDYVWLGAGLNNAAPADVILAYERPDVLDDGINLLFADGHVEFVQFWDLDGYFARSNEHRVKKGLEPVEVP